MGNICRSPTAEGIFRRLAGQHRELNCLEIDSCGTIGYHVGENADPRSVAVAKKRGYDLSSITSRKIKNEDLEYYDYILAMDSENLINTLALKSQDGVYTSKICLFLDYALNSNISDVPDPYYGGPSGFDDVIDLIEDASEGLIEELLKAERS